MTSLAFAFGCLPLAIALGAGANARHSIGTGIIGGMIGETTLAMLYVPLLFYLFDQLAEGKEEAGRYATRLHPLSGRPERLRWRRRRRPPTERGLGLMTRAAWHRIVAIAFAALLAGCMLGPDYERPTVDAPAAFRFEPKEVADTANTAWWQAVQRSGARSAHRRGARQQPERQGRRGQRRAGGRRLHADAVGALSADRLRRHRRARAHDGTGSDARSRSRAESADGVPGAAHRELGDRPVGPHPAAVANRHAPICSPPTRRAAA